MAAFPKRCQQIKTNGTLCGSPALRKHPYCYFHEHFHQERIRLTAEITRDSPPTFEMPTLEDANSIQAALCQVMRLLVSRQIDPKIAALLLYALQTASANLRRTDFQPVVNNVVFDPIQASETPLESKVWNDDDFDQEDNEEDADRNEVVAGRGNNKPAASSPKQLVARVSPSGHVAVTPPARRPPANIDMDAVRAKVRDIVRKAVIPPAG